jgi:hypothetical protein
MTSTKKWFTGIVVAVSVVYKFTEHMEYMKPVVTWLDNRIGGDTLIELLLGSLVIYLLLSHTEKEATAMEPAPAVQPIQANPNQSPVQTVSPIIDASQHHHHYPTPEPAKKEQPVLSPTPRKRTLNIVGKKGRIVWLEGMDVLYEREPKGHNSSRAVIVEFRNEPGEFSVNTWRGVVSSIIYYDEQGAEAAEIGRATWLERVSTSVNLESLRTYKLLIAVQATSAWIGFDGASGTVRLPEGIKRAKIVLHDDREFTRSWTLDFDLSIPAVGSLTSLTPPSGATR